MSPQHPSSLPWMLGSAPAWFSQFWVMGLWSGSQVYRIPLLPSLSGHVYNRSCLLGGTNQARFLASTSESPGDVGQPLFMLPDIDAGDAVALLLCFAERVWLPAPLPP